MVVSLRLKEEWRGEGCGRQGVCGQLEGRMTTGWSRDGGKQREGRRRFDILILCRIAMIKSTL